MKKFIIVVACLFAGKYVYDNSEFSERRVWTQTQSTVCLDALGHRCATYSRLPVTA